MALFDAHGVSTAAFLTAWNPLSQPQSDADNRAAQVQLQTAVGNLGLAFLGGVGRDPHSDWAEESLLVLGISLEQATSLASQFRQNAFVWIDRDSRPRLALVSEADVTFVDREHAADRI